MASWLRPCPGFWPTSSSWLLIKMRYLSVVVWALFGVSHATAQAISTQGISDLVKRRIPQHADSFQFSLVNAIPSVILSAADKPNDQYVVSTSDDGKVLVEGNSLSALSSGYGPPFVPRTRRDRAVCSGVGNMTLTAIVTMTTAFIDTCLRSHMSISTGILGIGWI
jgi:hypothetical protein